MKTVAGLRGDLADICSTLKLPVPAVALSYSAKHEELRLPVAAYGSSTATVVIKLASDTYTIHDALRICARLRNLEYLCYISDRENANHVGIHVVKAKRSSISSQGLRVYASEKLFVIPRYPEVSAVRTGKLYRSLCTRTLRAYGLHKSLVREGRITGNELRRRNLLLYLLAEQLYDMRCMPDVDAPFHGSYEHKFQFDEEGLFSMVTELLEAVCASEQDRNRIVQPPQPLAEVPPLVQTQATAFA